MKIDSEPFRTGSLLHSSGLIAAVALVLEFSLVAGTTQLLSERDSVLSLPAGGNGDSVAPQISGDARFVVFSSSASDLVTNDNGCSGLDVFLHDRSRNIAILISANSSSTGGGNGNSTLGQVSTHGRYVAFQSDVSDLVAGDSNGVSDIFIRDTFTGTTRLISVASDGNCGNGASTEPAMTPDGACVAFVSAATNLVRDDTNGIPDVFVRDSITQTTWLISEGAAGTNVTMATPVITPDGRSVAFFSTATNLAAGLPYSVSAYGRGEIYVHDRLVSTTAWASTNAATLAYNLLRIGMMPSTHPALSDDGRYVVFKTGWTNGTTAYTSGIRAVIIFLRDLQNGTTTIVSSNGYPPSFNCDDVYGPEMTPDGRFVAWVEREVTASATNSSIRLWDRLTGTNILVSADPNGLWPTNSKSHTPTLSEDGRYVTFLSDATNLVANVVSNGLHIYRRDLQTSTTVLLDADAGGIGSTDQAWAVPALSQDGRCAVFSTDSGLAGSGNGVLDVLLWDAAATTNQLISRRCSQAIRQSGSGASTGPLSFSGDGWRVAFASFASDLVANDSNGDGDVFVRDLAGESNVLASAGLDGNPATGGTSFSPIISADGRFVIFVSCATNLTLGDTNGMCDVFRRDLRNGTTAWVSTNAGSSVGKCDSFMPVCSRDGRYVAFLCRTDVPGGVTNGHLLWRDMDSGSTCTVSSGAHPTRAFSMSANGQRLAYFDSWCGLNVWDASLQTNVFADTNSLLTAAIAPTGTRLLCQATNELFSCDLPSGTNFLLGASKVPINGSSQWSGDGRYVAFVTATNLVPGDTNGVNDVYLHDLHLGTLTLVSANPGGPFSANGPSDLPVVSLDGRFVAFRSQATDIVPGIVKPHSLIAFDRLTGSSRLLVTGTSSGWTSWVIHPAFSADGAKLAFQGWDSGLVSGDLNRVGDVFAEPLNVGPMLDSDGDGVPDWWAILHFGHAAGEASDLSRAQDDADGDGLNNLDEYLAGTAPSDPGSVLALSIVTGTSGTNMRLSWDAAPGKAYQVLSATNLSAPDWQAHPGGIGVSGDQHHIEVQATNSQQFFRVSCRN